MYFFIDELLPILRQIQRPITPMIIHTDRVLYTSAESKHFVYRMSLHQDLYGNDFLKRVNFCNWIRRKMRTDVSFLSYVLFSDEANFANRGQA